MLYCGAHWQPTYIKRVIETFQTSTRVARVGTDSGNGFLKGLGNPAGKLSLAAELVAGELASWYGLDIPPFAIVSIGELPIPMIDGGYLAPGPAFISREVDGFAGTGGQGFADKIANPADVAKLVVFDTWIRNADRCHPEPDNYPPNYDNLFFTTAGAKFRLMALDHSQGFVESGLEENLSDPYLLNDDGVYGYYPEFSELIQFEPVTAAIQRLGEFPAALAAEIVDSIPEEWDISNTARAAWVSVIVQRAQRVAEYLPAKLLDEPGLQV
jgi:hypothetical protein